MISSVLLVSLAFTVVSIIVQTMFARPLEPMETTEFVESLSSLVQSAF